MRRLETVTYQHPAAVVVTSDIHAKKKTWQHVKHMSWASWEGYQGRYVCGPVNHEVPRTPIHAAMDRDGQRNGCEVDAIILRGEQGSVNGRRRREDTNGQSDDAEIGKRGSEIRHIHCPWSRPTNQFSKGCFRGELVTEEGRSNRFRRRSTSLWRL